MFLWFFSAFPFLNATIIATLARLSASCTLLSSFLCVCLSEHHCHHLPLLRKVYSLLIAFCANAGLILTYSTKYFLILSSRLSKWITLMSSNSFLYSCFFFLPWIPFSLICLLKPTHTWKPRSSPTLTELCQMMSALAHFLTVLHHDQCSENRDLNLAFIDLERYEANRHFFVCLHVFFWGSP